MGRLLYTREFSGSMEEFAFLARPVWNEHYRKTLLLNFFSLQYLKTIRQSSLECYALATHYKDEPVCLCLNLGYRAELFGRPLKVLLVSWFSLVRPSPVTGSALGLASAVHMCLDLFEYGKERGYDLVISIADASSGMLKVAGIKSGGIYPVISPPITASARILSRQVLDKIFLNSYEKYMVKALGREWPEDRSIHAEIEEIPLLKQATYEDILNKKVNYDFKIINEFSRFSPKDENFNRFFRIFEVKKRGEGIGVIRILDLELRDRISYPRPSLNRSGQGRAACGLAFPP